METFYGTNDLFIREATNDDCEQVKSLVFGVLHEYELKPDPKDTDADLNNIELNYHHRGGLFEVLVDCEETIVGTVGIYPIDLHTCELRKMYFAKSIRGKGYGRKLLERTLKQAKFYGFSTMTLETASVLKEAIHLYESVGFRQFIPEHKAERCDSAYMLEL